MLLSPPNFRSTNKTTMTIPSRSAPPVPLSSSASSDRRIANSHSNSTSNYAIMSAWSSPSDVSSDISSHASSSSSAVRKKPPPPRPPLPQALAAISQSTNAGRQHTAAKGTASLTNIFRRMKTNDNRSKDLFSLPPPPKAGEMGSITSHNKPPVPSQPDNREPSVELISFDSPPNSPTPTQMSISSWNSSLSFCSDLAATSTSTSHPSNTTAGAGISNCTANSTCSTTTHSESGFEDDFSSQAAFDPFSPVRTMPSYGFSSSTVYGASTSTAASKSHSKFWSPEFLDPLCNGESLLPPEPVVSMPTIIRPVLKTTTRSTVVTSSSRPQLKSHPKEVRQQHQRNERKYEKKTSREGLAMVLHQFDALQEGDLNLTPGRTIILLRQINDDWFHGRDEQGNEGMVPTSYVDVKEHPPSIASAAEPQSLPPQQPAPTVVPEPDQSTRRPARALFTFIAQTADDMTIVEDEPIVVLYKINDDWWYGTTSNGRQGQFPAAYVELL